MGTLFVSTAKPPAEYSEDDYLIEPEAYGDAVRKHWPDAQIVLPSGEIYILSWTLKNGSGLMGGLQSDRATVTFSSNPLQDAIDFILWHRAFVRPQTKLFLFDDNLTIVYELDRAVTRDELEAIF